MTLEEAAIIEDLNAECEALLFLEEHCPDCGSELCDIEGSMFCTHETCGWYRINH